MNEFSVKNLRHFFASLIGRKILLLGIMAMFGLLIAYFSGVFSSQHVTAQQFINLQEGDKPHPGFRRAHAKGICVTGAFESNGLLGDYSIAGIFAEGSTPFLGRFSIAGNNPTAPDLKAPVRSLAFVLNRGTNQEWRVAMNTPPVMAVATPDAFFEQLLALAPDPVTKKRDPSKIKAFFASHPESKAFINWKTNYVPTNSFATERYHSINAFYLVDENGRKQAVRWVAVPQTDEQSLPALDLDSPDALQQQLSQLLSGETVKFDMIFSLSDDSDDENNPTIPWPSNRKKINAGTLVVTNWESQETGKCSQMNFDPLVLPNGIEATADPILRARGSAYAESYRRRAKEILLGKAATVGKGE